MLRLISGLIVALVVTSVHSAEADKDYSALLREKGASYCSKAINKTANYLLDSSSEIVAVWNIEAPGQHGASILTGSRVGDTSGISHITASQNGAGGCDVAFTVTIPLPTACAALRESTFKEWKYFGVLSGLAVYDDPTTENVSVMLQPAGSGCVVVKMGSLFFDKASLK
jgi:hypothetical protein